MERVILVEPAAVAQLMNKRSLVLVPVVLFMLALLAISSVLSSFLKRPSLRVPSFVGLQTAKRTSLASRGNMTSEIPPFMYGTAWKKEKTKELVEMAVRIGFRGIDTACQPKHYHEPGVGDALVTLYEEGVVARSDLFLQTKFTSLNGQDPKRIPYNPASPLAEQVQESFNVSLRNLRTDYLDALVLHSPMEHFADTLTVWRAMESIHDRGGVRRLGVSNCYDVAMLRRLFEEARVKPSVLQNRFYKESGYDVQLRAFCAQHSITYQSFWTLTANPHILKSQEVRQLASRHGATPQQVLFRAVAALGVTPLTGSSSAQHLQQDLAALALALTPEELQLVHALLH